MLITNSLAQLPTKPRIVICTPTAMVLDTSGLVKAAGPVHRAIFVFGFVSFQRWWDRIQGCRRLWKVRVSRGAFCQVRDRNLVCVLGRNDFFDASQPKPSDTAMGR